MDFDVFVDDGEGVDIGCSIGKHECGQRFVELDQARTDAGHKTSPRVPAETVGQQPGQLGVSIGHVPMTLRVAQGVDAVSQCADRLVDELGLIQPLRLRLRSRKPF